MSHVHTPVCHMFTHLYVTCSHTCMSHVHTPGSHMFTHVYVTCSHTCMSHVHTPICHMFTHLYVTCSHSINQSMRINVRFLTRRRCQGRFKQHIQLQTASNHQNAPANAQTERKLQGPKQCTSVIQGKCDTP